jgi:hypothetical protein
MTLLSLYAALLSIAVTQGPIIQDQVADDAALKVYYLREKIDPEHAPCKQGPICIEWTCPGTNLTLAVGPVVTRVEDLGNGLVVFDVRSDGHVSAVGIDKMYAPEGFDPSSLPREPAYYEPGYRREIDTIFECAKTAQ